jgi:hypothetical protein
LSGSPQGRRHKWDDNDYHGRFGPVPDYLDAPLRKWIEAAVAAQPDLTLLQVRLGLLSPAASVRPAQQFANSLSAGQLLDAIDAILGLGGPWPMPENKPEALKESLSALLREGAAHVSLSKDGTHLLAPQSQKLSTQVSLMALNSQARERQVAEPTSQVDGSHNPVTERQPRSVGSKTGRLTAAQIFGVVVGIATIVGAVAAVLALTSH